ncbi:hypothetical protein HXY32_00095 [Candidatus Bathyarchaeota archaeon]|nr:hypothetical protein [Candidatus Bathyarchaeota archaeon]
MNHNFLKKVKLIELRKTALVPTLKYRKHAVKLAKEKGARMLVLETHRVMFQLSVFI